MNTQNKMIAIVELSDLKRKNPDKKIVFTNGCFDVLHIGHVRCLQTAASLGDILAVGLNSDQSVKMLKGESRPINSQEDRAEFLAAFDFINFICIYEEPTAVKLLEAVRPDIYVKGGDCRSKQYAEKEIVEKQGGVVVYTNYTEGKSTTMILNKVAVNEMLERNT